MIKDKGTPISRIYVRTDGHKLSVAVGYVRRSDAEAVRTFALSAATAAAWACEGKVSVDAEARDTMRMSRAVLRADAVPETAARAAVKFLQSTAYGAVPFTRECVQCGTRTEAVECLCGSHDFGFVG